MIVGYDAYHDSLRKGSSYGAIISSLNSNWTKYHGQVSQHSSKEELSNNFRTAIKSKYIIIQYLGFLNESYPGVFQTITCLCLRLFRLG